MFVVTKKWSEKKWKALIEKNSEIPDRSESIVIAWFQTVKV